MLGCAVSVLAAGCGGDRLRPTVDITSPAARTHIKGNVVSLDLKALGITIVKADGDASGSTGHFHVFIDKKPVAVGQVIPKAPGIVHSAEDPVKIYGLTVGRHTFEVVLGDGTHTRIGSGSKKLTLFVDGPSVHATAPAEVPAGQPVTITVKVQGVKLVKPDGDRSGKTGHLHVFVDRDPTPVNVPVPKVTDGSIIHTPDPTVTIPNLAPGEHTLWIVLGDGAHMQFVPPVMDMLIVTVK